MLYDSTKTLLQSIIQSLEVSLKTGDKAGWDDQIECGMQCLYEMHQMTRPSYRAYKSSDAKWPTHIPDSAKLKLAMPHVKAMVTAVRHRDQPGALASGRAALAEMNGAGPQRPAVYTPEPRAETQELSHVARKHKKPAGEHRPAVEKPRARRASAAGAN